MSRASTFLVVAAVAAVVVAAISARPRNEERASAPAAPAPASATAGLPRLVDLGAGKCIACREMAPILEQLRADYAGRMDVQFIDVWQDADAAEPYRVRMIPTQIFLGADGRELFRHEGFMAVRVSSAFAAGILASIGLVGAATAAVGRMLGDVGRVGNWLIAAVFFVVGLNLLGALPLPTFGSTPSSAGRRGAKGALLLGCVFGVALGPCTFAFMAPLLGVAFHASGTGGAAYGILLVGLYGLGHAAAIAFAGSSIQSVNRWLAWRKGARAVAAVKALAGIAVMLGGTYFISTSW